MLMNILIGLLVFCFDRVSKILVISNLIDKHISIIPNFLNIICAKNDGAAFSIFSGNTGFIIILSIIAILIIYFFFIRNHNINKIEMVGYNLLLGGIIGNLIDRIVYGYVIDFIDFKIFSYHFPTFNIADIAIVVGTFILILNTLKEDSNARNSYRRR